MAKYLVHMRVTITAKVGARIEAEDPEQAREYGEIHRRGYTELLEEHLKSLIRKDMSIELEIEDIEEVE